MAHQVYNKIFDEEKWKKVNPENKTIMDDFLQEMKAQKKSDGTLLQYKNDLRILLIYVLDNEDNKSLLELKKRSYRNFVLYCDEEWHLSNARINRLMSATRMICAYLEDDEDEYEDYERSAAAKIKGLPKQRVRDINFIPNEDIEALYQKFMDEERYRDATLLGILYDSGCRKNEILQVEKATIIDDGNATNKVIGKRGKVFPVLYFNHTKTAFKKYNETRKDDNPMLFVTGTGATATSSSLYDWVINWKKDLKEISGVDYDNLNVHTFRHCYIENLLNGSHWLCHELNLGAVPLEKIKSLAHHENSDTTLKYAINDENKDIEELLGIKLG